MNSPVVHAGTNTMNKSNQRSKSGPAQGGPKSAKAKKAKAKPQIKRDLALGEFKNPGVSQSRSFMNVAPVTKYLPGGDVVIRHREYIADVSGNGSAAFFNTVYAINPGLPGTFPWLSTIASAFESYQFEQLDFRYETQSATSSAGTIILTVDYDASDPAPATKTQALAYESAVRCAIWSDSDHRSLKKNLSKQKSLFIRRGALAANQDIKLYDVGNLNVCLQGNAATGLGELYVDYAVKLSTPQLGAVGVGNSVFGSFSGTVNSAPFGTVTGNLPATVVSTGTTNSVSTWTFSQPWEGYATVIIIGTGITSINPSGSGTEVEINDVYDATAIEGWSLNSLVEDNGQTFILTIANTTITTAIVYFAQADI